MASNRVECRHATCKHSFESHGSMQQHFLACHSQAEKRKQKYYACELCNRFFKREEALQAHMRSSLHHATPYDSQLAPITTIAPPVLPSNQIDQLLDQPAMACNDCGKTNLKGADALHQHQWASANHTLVSKSPNPNHRMRARACFQCHMKLPTAEDLEQHFVDQHPLSEVPKSSEERTWQQLEDCFQSAWIKSTVKLCKVNRIFKLYNPGWRRKDFEQYRKEIKAMMSNQKLIKEDNLELRNKVLHDGNELLRYHGTTVKCRLGQPPKPNDDNNEALSLCMDKNCSLCSILQGGFKKSKCRLNNFQRFGKGIYCSSTSSKAAAYVKCNELAQKASNNFKALYSACFGKDGSTNGKDNCKVMIICRVLAGRPYHSTRNLQNLNGPPCGFHSVQGDPGEHLNYDELVVYDDRAILPAYIILYTCSE